MPWIMDNKPPENEANDRALYNAFHTVAPITIGN